MSNQLYSYPRHASGKRNCQPFWFANIDLFQVQCAREVLSGQQLPGGGWCLATSGGDIYAKVVVNAAGLYGDKVEAIADKQTFK